jgi:hypothetical protein
MSPKASIKARDLIHKAHDRGFLSITQKSADECVAAVMDILHDRIEPFDL